MAKSQVASALKTRYRDLRVASPIKKPRTQTRKGRMIQPIALRKMVAQKNRSLTSVMEGLSQSPVNPTSSTKHPSKTPTQQPPTTKPTRPTNKQKGQALTEFHLRRSPRKHISTPTNKLSTKTNTGSTKKTTQTPTLSTAPSTQTATRPPPAPATQTARTTQSARTAPPAPTAQPDAWTQEVDVSSNIELDDGGPTAQTRSYGLVDEDLDNNDCAANDEQRLDEDDVGDNADGGDAMDGDGGSECVGDDEGSLSDSDKDGGSDEGDGEPMDGEEAGDATADHGDDGEAMDGEEHGDARADNGGVKSRRGRGPTRCLRYAGVTGRRRPKIVLNQFNQPIGPEPDVSSLANAIGILAKNTKVISLDFTSWRQVDKESKATLWGLTTNTFDVPEEAKDWVYKTACASWRSYKSRLKAKYYKEGMNVEDMLKVKYTEEIPPDQWEALVTYWCDPKTVDLSSRNRRSVQQRKNVHTAGSCSFARIVAKETKNGKEPSMAAIYIKIRTRKNGAALISDQTKADLLNLENDAEVEDYLVSKDLLRTRSGRLHSREGLFPKGT